MFVIERLKDSSEVELKVTDSLVIDVFRLYP